MMAEVAQSTTVVPPPTARSHSAPVSSHATHQASDITNGRNRSESSNSSNSASENDSLKDVPVVMRRSRNHTNGSNDGRNIKQKNNESISGSDTTSISSFEKREEELFRRRSASVLEVKEHAHARLNEELLRAQNDLKLKDEQCKKLFRVQDQMGQELEELTASLFEEANKMVQDANVKRMQSEKLLKESRAQVEILQAEVTALKSMLITSTPSMPNRHLHPQIDSHMQRKDFVKGHRRSTSHHNFSKDVTTKEVEFAIPPPPPPVEEKEVDPVYFDEFKAWRSKPCMDDKSVFLAHIIREEIAPCLSFNNEELSKSIFANILNNSVTIEPVAEKNPFPRTCALSGAQRACKYRVRLGDNQQQHLISCLARNRITSVCDFFLYIRYIIQGLVKSDDKDVYWEIIRLRKQMAISRLGLS